jgi:hypothetical protein
MKQENPYVISEFTNPSGKIVFQLYARIDGKRFRKNFPTRAEAETERQILGIQYLQETEMRVAATRLADAQLRVASASVRNFAAPTCYDGRDDNKQDDDVGATERARRPRAAGAAFHDVASGPATGRAHPGGTLASGGRACAARRAERHGGEAEAQLLRSETPT